MNVERIQQLRDHLAALKPSAFNMASWFGRDHFDSTFHMHQQGLTNATALEGSCGTTACIAGHVLAVFNPNGVIPVAYDTSNEAAEILGLNLIQRDRLFTPKTHEYTPRADALPHGRNHHGVTLPEAVKVLDHLLLTGEVDWRVIA